MTLRVIYFTVVLFAFAEGGSKCLCHCPCDNASDDQQRLVAPPPLNVTTPRIENKTIGNTNNKPPAVISPPTKKSLARTIDGNGFYLDQEHADVYSAPYINDTYVDQRNVIHQLQNVLINETDREVRASNAHNRTKRSEDCIAGFHRCQNGATIFKGTIGADRCTGSFREDDDFQLDLRSIMEELYPLSEIMWDKETPVEDYPTISSDICEKFGYKKSYHNYDWKDWTIYSDVTFWESLIPRYLGAVLKVNCADLDLTLKPTLVFWHRYTPTIDFPKYSNQPAGRILINNNIDRTAWTWTVLIVDLDCGALSSNLFSGDCRNNFCLDL